LYVKLQQFVIYTHNFRHKTIHAAAEESCYIAQTRYYPAIIDGKSSLEISYPFIEQ